MNVGKRNGDSVLEDIEQRLVGVEKASSESDRRLNHGKGCGEREDGFQ